MIGEPDHKLVTDLMDIIPSWRTVNLTKAGYNQQYLHTLKNLHDYILKREAKLKRKAEK